MHDIWNPWHGCTKISPGCQNCYMYALDEYREVKTPSNQCHKTGQFKYPLSKYRNGEYKIKPGERIRVNMTSDTFLSDADEWRDEIWEIIKKRSDVIFWLLTKRANRILNHLPEDWPENYKNVSLNITCENQQMFDERIDYLLEINAYHKGLCLAPLLSDIDLTYALQTGQIEEISIGGENYNNPRPCRYEWVKHIAKQCEQYQVNFTWYETGTNFIKDNKKYYIPKKAIQAKLPYFAGFNKIYKPIIFDLKDENNNSVKPINRTFNTNNCLFCANQLMCNGCSACGNCCVPPNLVDEATFLKIQAQKETEVNK